MAALDPLIKDGIEKEGIEGEGERAASVMDPNPASTHAATRSSPASSEPVAGAPEMTSDKQVARALDDFAVALVKADGGEVYLVRATSDEVHLHLAGTCAGCPGATMTRERLLAPTVKSVLPKATLTVTTGWRVPEGAVKIGS